MASGKSDKQSMFEALLIVFVLYFGIGYFAKGCAASEKEEKIIALTDSIEKTLDERDSTLRKTYEGLAYRFRKDKYQCYDKYGNEYKSEICYDEDGDSIGTPEEMTARVFDYLKEHVETDCYSELEEIREIIND